MMNEFKQQLVDLWTRDIESIQSNPNLSFETKSKIILDLREAIKEIILEG